MGTTCTNAQFAENVYAISELTCLQDSCWGKNLTSDFLGAIIMGKNEDYFHPTRPYCILPAKLSNTRTRFSLHPVIPSNFCPFLGLFGLRDLQILQIGKPWFVLDTHLDKSAAWALEKKRWYAINYQMSNRDKDFKTWNNEMLPYLSDIFERQRVGWNQMLLSLTTIFQERRPLLALGNQGTFTQILVPSILETQISGVNCWAQKFPTQAHFVMRIDPW